MSLVKNLIRKVALGWRRKYPPFRGHLDTCWSRSAKARISRFTAAECAAAKPRSSQWHSVRSRSHLRGFGGSSTNTRSQLTSIQSGQRSLSRSLAMKGGRSSYLRIRVVSVWI